MHSLFDFDEQFREAGTANLMTTSQESRMAHRTKLLDLERDVRWFATFRFRLLIFVPLVVCRSFKGEDVQMS